MGKNGLTRSLPWCLLMRAVMRRVVFVLLCLFSGLVTGLAGFSGWVIGLMHSERGYSTASAMIAFSGLLMILGPFVFWVIIPACWLIRHGHELDK